MKINYKVTKSVSVDGKFTLENSEFDNYYLADLGIKYEF
jgi:hypothetical protein